MDKHFHFDQFSGRPPDSLFPNFPADSRNPIQGELPGQHNHIRVAGVKTDRFRVGNICLNRKMHRQTVFFCRADDGRIHGDDRINSCFRRQTAESPDLLPFLIKDHCVEREPCFYVSCATASTDDFRQILFRKIHGGSGSHIEFPRTEIDGIRSVLQSGFQ